MTTIKKAIARAWVDGAYKAKLLRDPHAALADVGVRVPAGATVKVVENTADSHYIALPMAPANAGELSEEELENVAGGMIDPDFGLRPAKTLNKE